MSFEFGTLREVCRASANLCDQLELAAMVSAAHPEVIAPTKAKMPSQVIEPDLEELRSLAIALDGQDAILLDGIRTVRGYEVSEAQWNAVASVLRDIFAKLPELAIPLEFHGQPFALRSQISTVRVRLQRKIEGLEHSRKSAVLSIGKQIDRLRDECGLSIEELSEKVGIHPTNVSRHIHDESVPSRTTLPKYNRAFSKLLNREIVIRKTQPERS